MDNKLLETIIADLQKYIDSTDYKYTGKPLYLLDRLERKLKETK